MPRSRAASATLAAGSMPSAGMPRVDDVLQQVAVVAGDLDDEAVGAEPEPLDRRRRRSARAWSTQESEYDEK